MATIQHARPLDVMQQMGYGLFTARKQEQERVRELAIEQPTGPLQ